MDNECKKEIKKSAKGCASEVWSLGIAVDTLAGVLLLIFIVARIIR